MFTQGVKGSGTKFDFGGVIIAGNFSAVKAVFGEMFGCMEMFTDNPYGLSHVHQRAKNQKSDFRKRPDRA